MWQPNVASDVEPDCSCTRLVYNTGADNTYTLLLRVWYAVGFVGETVKCLNQRQLTWYAEWRCREFVKWRKRITFTEERKREVDTLRKKVVLESWVCCERCQDGPLMLKSYPLCFHLFLTHTHTHAHIIIHKSTNIHTGTIEHWPLGSMCESIWKQRVADASIDVTVHSLSPSSPLVLHPTTLCLILSVWQTSRMWGPAHRGTTEWTRTDEVKFCSYQRLPSAGYYWHSMTV